MKILFATDGSAHARLAETFLTRIPGIERVGVDVVSVAQTPAIVAPLTPATGAMMYIQASEELIVSLREHAQRESSAAVDRLRAAGIHAAARVLEGDPPGTLLLEIERNGYDLVVVGSRGEGAVAGFLLGSVARRLVAYSPCSVLVVRDYEGLAAEESVHRLRGKDSLSVIAAVDDSDGAARGIEWLLAHPGWDEILVVSVEPYMVLPPGLDPTLIPLELPADTARAEAVAQGIAERLRPAARSTSTVAVLDRPSSAIARIALDRQADLIVVGARGHSGLERFLIGSVSYELATSAPCAVLVAR